MNLEFTKGTVRPGRLLWLVAAGVAAAAGILPAQGAAARNRHNVESAHARLAHRTLRVRGTEANDVIALRLASGNSARVQVDLGDDGSADFSFSRAAIARISVRGRGGDDRIRIDDRNGAFTNDIPTRVDGGRGNDTIAGGAGAETLLGGPSDDSIDGNGGSDVSNLGPGDDSFVWDPGDGSDTIEGNDGTDALVFNGAAASETVNLSANGDRLRFFRNPGNITMDTHGVEQADFNALGGTDAITVNDLTGTDVRNVNLDLAGSLGGVTGDGQTDTVLVAGTNGNDSLTATGGASGVTVSGLQAQVAIRHQEPTDQLVVGGLAGDDAISATGLAAGAITEFLEGLDGNDTILGGPGAETLLGGNGNDTIDGNGGSDGAGLGAGSDTFVWDPGDGSDTIEGNDGTDTMVFNGAAASENVALSANGDRLRFFRNPGNIAMDTHGVERVDFNALGGADFIDVGNLGATDVTSLNLDLAATLGGSTGDDAVDSVLVAGTPGADAASISGDASGVKVSGLHTSVAIQHHELGDSLSVAGLGGADTIDASNLAATTIGLVLAGNAGNDTLDGGKGVEILKGAEGNDVVDGNGGNDLADLGAGSDTFVWDPGDGSDTIEGGEDMDTMVFNGAAAAETVNLSAIGDRLRFFRNPGGITMDTHGVERVAFNALGGADTVAVHDLSATDVSQVDLDLAGTLGGSTGDGQTDHVVVDGTEGNDAISVAGDASDVHVTGLAPSVDLLHAEATDRLDFETFSGIDTVASGGLVAGTLQVFLDGLPVL